MLLIFSLNIQLVFWGNYKKEKTSFFTLECLVNIQIRAYIRGLFLCHFSYLNCLPMGHPSSKMQHETHLLRLEHGLTFCDHEHEIHLHKLQSEAIFCDCEHRTYL